MPQRDVDPPVLALGKLQEETWRRNITMEFEAIVILQHLMEFQNLVVIVSLTGYDSCVIALVNVTKQLLGKSFLRRKTMQGIVNMNP